MSLSTVNDRAPTERVPTGLEGLDQVLQGGLTRRSGILVTGDPGTGKTTLGNQLAYTHARSGGVALFATALVESHDRMIENLAGFKFFDRGLVGGGVYYVSLDDELKSAGLPGALELLRGHARRLRATLVVIDGVSRFGDFAASVKDYRLFVSELYLQLTALGCTALLLTMPEWDQIKTAETQADVILRLSTEQDRARDIRCLSIQKRRGAPHLTGSHEYLITDDGLVVLPRLEATQPSENPAMERTSSRMAFGLTGLDDMLGGGVSPQSSTLVVGAPGSGKTILGLHFLIEGASRGEAGLIATFHDTAGRLVAKAAELGLDLDAHIQSGLIKVFRYPAIELHLDDWGRQVLRSVSGQQAKRVFIDSITDVQGLAARPDRLPAFATALTRSLDAYGATSVVAAEIRTLIARDLELPVPIFSGTVQNTILLRYVETPSGLRRFISVLKGEGETDPSPNEVRIVERRLEVVPTDTDPGAVPLSIATSL